MQLGESLEDLTASLARQTRSYLAGEMSTDTLAFQDVTADPVTATLKEHTVIMGVGGSSGFLTAFSFSQELGDRLFQQTTSQMDISPEEGMTYRHSVLAEAVNVIVGHWLAEIGQPDTAISLSPPIVLNGTQNIHLQDDAVFTSTSLMTDAGSVDIHIMGTQNAVREKAQPPRRHP